MPAKEIQCLTRPIVDDAVDALRTFGGDLDRLFAEQLLGMWRRYRELTATQRAAVVERFPPYVRSSPGGPNRG